MPQLTALASWGGRARLLAALRTPESRTQCFPMPFRHPVPRTSHLASAFVWPSRCGICKHEIKQNQARPVQGTKMINIPVATPMSNVPVAAGRPAQGFELLQRP